MTRRQAQLLEFLQASELVNRGVTPSLDEMAAALGLKSKSGIHRILTSLEEQGRIARHYRRARTVIVTDPAAPTADELRGMVLRLVAEEGPTRTIAALVDLAQELAPQIEEGV